MNSLQRVGVAALGAAFLFIPASLVAQPYVFTKIADTVSHPAAGLDGGGCVAMNKHGSVVVVGGDGRAVAGKRRRVHHGRSRHRQLSVD
jgi:hypothetical protein